MEQKKFDLNSLIGFLLIGGILIWMLYLNKPTEEEIQAEKAKTEAAAKQDVEASKTKEEVTLAQATSDSMTVKGDSLAFEQLKNKLGSFAYSETLPSATEGTTVLENDVLYLEVSNKGGYITEALLKNFTKYDSVLASGGGILNSPRDTALSKSAVELSRYRLLMFGLVG